jgi:hypothetical protein
VPIGPSGDSAEPPEEKDPPPSGRPFSWLATHGRNPLVWAAAALVVMGGTGAILVAQDAGGQAAGRPRAQGALCGLVSCADVRSAAASMRSGHRAAPTPTPTTPPATATPAPRPAASPVPAASPEPAATAPGHAPTPARTHRPGPAPAWPPPHGPWPPRWPPPWRGGYPGGWRHSHWSSWWR